MGKYKTVCPIFINSNKYQKHVSNESCTYKIPLKKLRTVFEYDANLHFLNIYIQPI